MVDNSKSLKFQSFIIYDPSLTNNENEARKKILYCHPITIPIDQQQNTTGLCEAMCNFSREFTESPCQYIHTMKTRIVLQTLENDIKMILTVSVPNIAEKIPLPELPLSVKKIDADNYQDEEIQNSICESIITHCRQMFFLFMGPPSLIIKNSGIDCLKEKLSKFFDRYIGNGMLDGYHVTDGLTGVHFLPVDHDMMSRVVDLLGNLQSKFRDIFSSMFLFNNNLVYSTVDKEDLGILYRYLTTTLLAKYNIYDTMNSLFTMTNLGRFVLVSQEPSVGFQSSSHPKIYFRTDRYLNGDEASMKKCLVLVYKAVQATVVLFVDENADINETFNNSVDAFLGPAITILVKSIFKKCDKIVADNPYKYIYWDPDSLSLKCTLFPTRQFKSDLAPLVPIDCLQLMTDIKVEMDRNHQLKEMSVKLHTESWVSVVKDIQQELFVAINRKNISFVDVSKEVKLICNRDFADTFKVNND